MTDRPIIFNGAMVNALLNGRKSMTRRVLKPWPGAQAKWLTMETLHRAPTCYLCEVGGHLGVQMQHPLAGQAGNDAMSPLGWVRLPYAPGDRLWVRETFATWDGGARDLAYRADTSGSEWSDLLHDRRHGAPWRVRPSIHMPRWASRLTLTVTDVRVQRLNSLTDDDAIAEGIQPQHVQTARQGSAVLGWGYDGLDGYGPGTPKAAFSLLWNTIHGPDAWDANPWVCAISFTVEQRNIDE